ncbi:MAG: MazG family protein [Oscillospiraceae bacterium]|jgi:tetrapyrrole methylase family protein/MazG family protein|nr:MazG family protein [Oscillospiraceae bacterium]
MVNFESREKYGVYDLQRLIKILRSPDGCPWDIEQTHESIRRNFLEEAYEAVEAIDEGDAPHLREELGDVLTQVVFHSDIEDDAGRFDLDDVADATVRKLLYRHPHVFGDAVAETSGAVLENWDELKRKEKSQETLYDELTAVARSLPALWRAEKVQKKAAKAGYALDPGEVDPKADPLTAIGEMLFFTVDAARQLNIDPEDALNAATERFILRFNEQ